MAKIIKHYSTVETNPIFSGKYFEDSAGARLKNPIFKSGEFGKYAGHETINPIFEGGKFKSCAGIESMNPIFKGGKFELDDYAKRPKDTSAHWYNVFEDLLRREVMEEVGLKIRNIRYLTSMSYIRSDNIPTIIVSLFSDHDEGAVKLCPVLTEYAWVTLEEAKNYDLIEGIYEELEMLDRFLKGEDVGTWQKKSD